MEEQTTFRNLLSSNKLLLLDTRSTSDCQWLTGILFLSSFRFHIGTWALLNRTKIKVKGNENVNLARNIQKMDWTGMKSNLKILNQARGNKFRGF